jgi:hypothetical protein
MASTNLAASVYFQQEYDRDLQHFCIGTCPCGRPGLLFKAALPNSIQCGCSHNGHNWSSITLVPELQKVVPTKRRTTKQDLLDTLNYWLQVREDLGGADALDLQLMHVQATDGANGVSDHDDILTLVEGTSSDPKSMKHLIIANIINLAKHPYSLFRFALNGFYLIQALAQGDIFAVVRHIQPFIHRFAPQWAIHINDEFMREMDAVLQQEHTKSTFWRIQSELDHVNYDETAAHSDSARHLRDLQDTLGGRGC